MYEPTTEKTKQKDSKPKQLSGLVVSTKMKDTVVIEVSQFKKVPKYGKFVKRSKRFMAHDEGNKRIMGETITIEECRPMSKHKHFRVV